MIAADTSTWVAFLQGDSGKDASLLASSLADKRVLMPPAVLTELLSDPGLPEATASELLRIPLVETLSGYWERAGILRSRALRRRRKARLGDALIAQACLDRGIPLITRDGDFRAFADAEGLQLIIG